MPSTLDAPEVPKPTVDFDQEVRFAVVMYGGSSLAIYINGVAQELLRLVRATAPEAGGSHGADMHVAHVPDEELSGSERVYRLIGRVLDRQGVHLEHVNKSALDPRERTPIRTRFVVDILTGTSAGGINAVYLAKALANNQDIDDLKNLWVQEGDIGVLINDPDSYEPLNPRLAEDPGEPWSLLNSRRMYLRLLQALRGMDTRKKASPRGQSPLVDELDLYVTATDMTGRVVQFRLADDVINEYRHRNVFHFRYRSPRSSDSDVSDFGPEYNAFLAFAARATSAHQAAFAPVRLDDVGPVVEKYPASEEHPPDDKVLRAFYRDYLLQRAHEEGDAAGAAADPDAQAEKLAEAFRGVWFVDGGTLDNKPFSFVAEELPLRHADRYVDRKLLYVEPSPDELKAARPTSERPRIVANALAALSSLPRYETIVEDLTRLLERNRLIERVANITADLEDDIQNRHGGRWPRARARDERRGLKVSDLIAEKGAAWGGYQRLRIGQVTDELTVLVARAAGFSEESGEVVAIRHIVRHWRRERYDDHDSRKEAELGFLVDYDLLWNMRRVRFVLRKIDELSALDGRARKLAQQTEQSELGITITWPEDAEQTEEFRRALRKARAALSTAFMGLRSARRRFWAYGKGNPFRDEVEALGISGQDLRDFLKLQTKEERLNTLRKYLEVPQRRAAFEQLVEAVRVAFGKEIDEAREKCRSALPGTAEPGRLDPARSVPYILLYYYTYYEDFDQVSFPVFYSTGVGEEADVIDVFRISPEDARAIVNEKREGKRKLAGTTLGNFGAFFERKFRVNDIMWGRLDGAERIIAALLPAHPELRDELTREAHRAIIKEEVASKITSARREAEEVLAKLGANDRRARGLFDRVTKALRLMEMSLDSVEAPPAARTNAPDLEGHLSAIEQGAAGLPQDSAGRMFLEAFVREFRPLVRDYVVPCARGEDSLDAFKRWFLAQYEEGRKFSPDATIKAAVRINRVLGGMGHSYFDPEGERSRREKLKIWLGLSKPPEGEMGRKQMLLVRIGKKLQTFAEAAIQPSGDAYRSLRLRVVAGYLVSAVFLFLVLIPATALLLTETGGLVRVGLAVVLALTFLVAVIPLLLTALYHLAWNKLQSTVAGRLHRGRSGPSGQERV